MGGYEQRVKQKNLTGEWLIFAKYENLNYYLCFTQHSSTKDGDEAIFAMIKEYCENQYPFLFSIAV